MLKYTSPATNITQNKTQIIRLKDEIKFLYTKKEKLNNHLYRIHLRATHALGNTLYTILDSIHASINQELERKYKTIDEKIEKKIVHTQAKNRHGKLLSSSHQQNRHSRYQQ